MGFPATNLYPPGDRLPSRGGGLTNFGRVIRSKNMANNRITTVSHLIAVRLRLDQVARLDAHCRRQRSDRSKVVRRAIDREIGIPVGRMGRMGMMGGKARK